MKANKVLISAYNINAGGGLLLLKSLLETIPSNTNIVLFADKRLQGSEVEKINSKLVQIHYVKNSLPARIWAELKMTSMSKEFSSHFCLGNLPPLFGSHSKVTVYLHTRYIVDRSIDNLIPIRKFLITSLERVWFKFTIKNRHKVIVQTPTMLELTHKFAGHSLNIKELLFLPQIVANKNDAKEASDFLYVASYDAHKNFDNLIEAWTLLNAEGIRPKLNLVVSGNVPSDFVSRIQNLNIKLNININRNELLQFYASTKCLIHPSYYESLGIVLIEAKRFGLDVIAPEADYVRDVLEPSETFDPHSPKSISRSVKRYLNIPQTFVEELSPSDLWNCLND